jgi:peptidylprolyl isomerase
MDRLKIKTNYGEVKMATAKKTVKETKAGGVEKTVEKAPKAKAGDGAKAGDTVKVEYSGKFSDGKEFDNSAWHGAPLQFQLGAGQVVPGFEKAIMGMKKGEKKTFTIKAAEAYGVPRPELVREIPRQTLPMDEGSEEKFKPGMTIVLGAPNGMKLPAVVREISPTKLVVDFNHPLAGKDLTFEIKLVE